MPPKLAVAERLGGIYALEGVMTDFSNPIEEFRTAPNRRPRMRRLNGRGISPPEPSSPRCC